MDDRRAARYAPAVGFASYVFVASVVDPGTAGEWLSSTLFGVGLDTWLHLGTYAVLACLLGFARDATTARALVLVVIVVAAYGAGVEVVQALLPARAFDSGDAAANAVGAGAGAACWRGLRAAGRRLAARGA